MISNVSLVRFYFGKDVASRAIHTYSNFVAKWLLTEVGIPNANANG